LRGVEAPFGQPLPVFGTSNLGIEFVLPEYVESLPLRVIIHAREADQRRVAGTRRGRHLVDKVQALADVDDGAWFWNRAVREERCRCHDLGYRTVQDNPFPREGLAVMM
jgi:hypothetical protein